jgi:hypothetical protein
VSLIRRSVENDELRGVVLLVARHGKIVLHEALGFRDNLSVECATAVKSIQDANSGFYRYYGNTWILNGVPYSIQIEQSGS